MTFFRHFWKSNPQAFLVCQFVYQIFALIAMWTCWLDHHMDEFWKERSNSFPTFWFRVRLWSKLTLPSRHLFWTFNTLALRPSFKSSFLGLSGLEISWVLINLKMKWNRRRWLKISIEKFLDKHLAGRRLQQCTDRYQMNILDCKKPQSIHKVFWKHGGLQAPGLIKIFWFLNKIIK